MPDAAWGAVVSTRLPGLTSGSLARKSEFTAWTAMKYVAPLAKLSELLERSSWKATGAPSGGTASVGICRNGMMSASSGRSRLRASSGESSAKSADASRSRPGRSAARPDPTAQ